ncbi:hypothetical protein MHYP_G00097610 [Metynnis hypsauchen]
MLKVPVKSKYIFNFTSSLSYLSSLVLNAHGVIRRRESLYPIHLHPNPPFFLAPYLFLKPLGPQSSLMTPSPSWAHLGVGRWLCYQRRLSQAEMSIDRGRRESARERPRLFKQAPPAGSEVLTAA